MKKLLFAPIATFLFLALPAQMVLHKPMQTELMLFPAGKFI